MKALLIAYVILFIGCSAVTNYRRYDFFLDK